MAHADTLEQDVADDPRDGAGRGNEDAEASSDKPHRQIDRHQIESENREAGAGEDVERDDRQHEQAASTHSHPTRQLLEFLFQPLSSSRRTGPTHPARKRAVRRSIHSCWAGRGIRARDRIRGVSHP